MGNLSDTKAPGYQRNDNCPGCAKIRILHKHPVGDYYCHQCILKINQALRKKNIDPKKLTHATFQTKDAIRDFIFWQVELVNPKGKRKTK